MLIREQELFLVLLYPIDLVKVRYQVYDKSGNAYTSLTQAFRTIVQQEGFSGLYQVYFFVDLFSISLIIIDLGFNSINNCISFIMGWLFLLL